MPALSLCRYCKATIFDDVTGARPTSRRSSRAELLQGLTALTTHGRTPIVNSATSSAQLHPPWPCVATAQRTIFTPKYSSRHW